MEGKKVEDKTLDQLLSTFVTSLDVDSVVDDCVSADLITMDDLEKIQAKVKSGDKKAAIRELISQLKRNAPGYLKKFHEVLMGNTSMSFLGDEIVKSKNCKKGAVWCLCACRTHGRLNMILVTLLV